MELGLDEWQALIGYCLSHDRSLRHLGVPPEIAEQLGIELPPPPLKKEENGMSEENKPLMLSWKRKKYFDGETCGVKGCTKPADGYVCDVKPTKGGKPGKLWFGPACTKCVQAKHPTLKPTTLAELAHQRNGVSDLAMVLNIEVGEMKNRLAEAGIDEKGQTVVNIQGGEAQTNPQTNLVMTEEQIAASGGASVQVEPVHSHIAVIQTEAIMVDTAELLSAEQEAHQVLVFLNTFHIFDQAGMDNASNWLKEVKRKWNELDEKRKSIVRPWQEKIKEVQNYFRSPLNVFAQAETLLKQKIAEGNQRAQEAQRRALEEAQRALQAGNQAAMAHATQAAAQSDVSLPQGIGQRSITRFEIVDPSQVPGNFWGVIPSLIQEAINRGVKQIPGVRIWEEPVVSVRT